MNLGEPELLRVEPLCGTLGSLHLVRTFKSGTFMWNLAEPGSKFRAPGANHPEALLEEPPAFQAGGEKSPSQT